VSNVVVRSLPENMRDLRIVIVNDPVYGGSGGPTVIISNCCNLAELVLHELGHSFGRLADEYDYGGTTTTDCVTMREPNVANDDAVFNHHNNIPWIHWIDATTQIPTLIGNTTTCPQNLINVPGAYQGARYCPFNLWRPTCLSKLRQRFIPSRQLIRRFSSEKYIDVFI